MRREAIALGGLIAAGAVAGWAGLVGVSLEGLTAGDLVTKFMGLVLVALIIERAVEVFINTQFAEAEAAVRRPVRSARLAVRTAQDSLDHEVARGVPRSPNAAALRVDMDAKSARVSRAEDTLRASESQLGEKLDVAAGELERLSLRRQRFAALLALIFGAAAGMVGIRALGQFLPTSADGRVSHPITAEPVQFFLFTAVDVVLTALLLAGGAQGLHNLLGGFLSAQKPLDKSL